jgi:hypothetical protein
MDSLEALRLEKLRLQVELEETENQLKDDLKWVMQGIHPLRIISKSLSKIMDPKDNGLISDGIGTGMAMLVSKLLPRRSFWIAKLFLPGIVRRLASNVIGDNKEDIIGTIRKMIHKFKSQNHKHNGWYDSSTAQEQY